MITNNLNQFHDILYHVYASESQNLCLLLSARLEYALPTWLFTWMSHKYLKKHYKFCTEFLSPPLPPNLFLFQSSTSKWHHQPPRLRPESWRHPWFLSPSTAKPFSKYFWFHPQNIWTQHLLCSSSSTKIPSTKSYSSSLPASSLASQEASDL